MAKAESRSLIQKLEAPEPLGHRDKAAVIDAIDALFPGRSMWPEARAEKSASADVALYVAEKAFPNWDITLTGKTSATHGNWICTIRVSATRDDDEVIGIGSSQMLAHAIYAACLKLAEQKHHL